MFSFSAPRFTLTVSTGTGYKTLPIAQCLLQHIFVKAANETTVFDVQIENSYGDVMYSEQDVDGELNEEVLLPFAKNGTLRILNATVPDEEFTCTLSVRES